MISATYETSGKNTEFKFRSRQLGTQKKRPRDVINLQLGEVAALGGWASFRIVFTSSITNRKSFFPEFPLCMNARMSEVVDINSSEFQVVMNAPLPQPPVYADRKVGREITSMCDFAHS